MDTKKLTVKDLIQVGIFAAILLVVKTIVGFIGVVPILCAILPAITALVCAPVYCVFLTRVRKFGMITILASVLGLIFSFAGYGWEAFAGSFVAGLLADLVSKTGNYVKKTSLSLGYGLFSLWGISLFLIIWVSGDAYFADLTTSMGAEFAEAFQKLVPVWSVLWIGALTFICGLIGMTYGMKLAKKHFNKNGETDEWN